MVPAMKKTIETNKKTIIILILLLVCLCGAWLLYTHPFWSNGFTRQTDSKADHASQFDIPPYISSNDEDGDGIDDQTDMLKSARDYIATKPQYKSQYYSGGYPDDGYGVCTDVVAFACKGTGYDLMQLVSEDVNAHKDAYGIDRKSTRLNSSHGAKSRMPSSA